MSMALSWKDHHNVKIIIATIAVVIGSLLDGILLSLVVATPRSSVPAVQEQNPTTEPTPSPTPSPITNGLVGQDIIRQNAEPYMGGAAIDSIEVENEHNVQLYKVKLSDDRELFFNAQTGAFIGEEQDNTKGGRN